MDDSRSQPAGWAPLLKIGSSSFPATLLLTGLATLLVLWWAPFLSYVFGSGGMPASLISLALFLLLLIFRKTILHNAHDQLVEADEALLEYFTQQNTGANGEEVVAVELMENALHLKTVRAYDCMAPRPEIVYIDAGAPVEELRHLFVESSLSRILVTEGELDKVLGYIHVQQMFNRPAHIRDIVLPITFVPETMPANDLLHKFIRSRSSIACVVDEYGSLAGLVTLEDALEQLFGEIDDEHDQEEFIDAQVSPAEFIFSGRLRVDYLNEKYPALSIPPGDYNTLSGYLVATAATLPEQGARLELDGKTYVLELVSDRKIETVRVLL